MGENSAVASSHSDDKVNAVISSLFIKDQRKRKAKGGRSHKLGVIQRGNTAAQTDRSHRTSVDNTDGPLRSCRIKAEGKAEAKRAGL